jgi:hypothetical protein
MMLLGLLLGRQTWTGAMHGPLPLCDVKASVPALFLFSSLLFVFVMAVVVSSTVATPVSGVVLVTATASSISCNWSSAAEVVGQIQENKLNVADVVARCANVCQVAFQSSNAAGVSILRFLSLGSLANGLIRPLQGKG